MLEFVIAQALGVLVMGMMITVVVVALKTAAVQHAWADVGDHGRFVSIFFKKQLAFLLSHCPPGCCAVEAHNNTLSVTDCRQRARKRLYFTALTSRVRHNGTAMNALYRRAWVPGKRAFDEELVPGVSRFKAVVVAGQLMLHFVLSSDDGFLQQSWCMMVPLGAS